MCKINSLWQDSETRTNFIPKDITDLSSVGFGKKKIILKAIYWLLSKAPHSIDEIAEHFEVSTELVKGLIEELITSNMVYEFVGNSRRFKAKENNQLVNN